MDYIFGYNYEFKDLIFHWQKYLRIKKINYLVFNEL